MTKTERLERITDYTRINTSATIQELTDILKVSHMTIRRDVISLEEKGVLTVIHGGVIFNDDTHTDGYRMSLARTNMLEEKQKIARKAVSLIEPNDTIIIDAGSTGELIATFLPQDIPLTVICYALNIAIIVAKKPNCTLIVSGGYYHESSMVLESPEGLELLKQNRANKAFITASGVSTSLGITCSNFFERAVKHAALKSCHTSVLVADSSKFNVIKSGHFADITDFDIIITDKGISEECLTSIKETSNKTLLIVG